MKEMEELEKMTLWDITANEGALTMVWLSAMFAALAIGYFTIALYFKVKFKILSIRR